MRETKPSAFAFYLRTGRIVDYRETDQALPLETKFNPWHDPLNGQFTFAGAGKFSGGGGSFGGGGATGSWGSKQPKSRIRQLPARPNDKRSESRLFKPLTDAPGSRPERPRAQRVPQRGATINPPARRTVAKNGYTFHLDSRDNPHRISVLRLDPSENRSRQAQAQAGGADHQSTDDGGHYIGVRFAVRVMNLITLPKIQILTAALIANLKTIGRKRSGAEIACSLISRHITTAGGHGLTR